MFKEKNYKNTRIRGEDMLRSEQERQPHTSQGSCAGSARAKEQQELRERFRFQGRWSPVALPTAVAVRPGCTAHDSETQGPTDCLLSPQYQWTELNPAVTLEGTAGPRQKDPRSLPADWDGSSCCSTERGVPWVSAPACSFVPRQPLVSVEVVGPGISRATPGLLGFQEGGAGPVTFLSALLPRGP